MNLEEFRKAMESDAAVENERLKRDLVDVEKRYRDMSEGYTDRIQWLNSDCRALANRCFSTINPVKLQKDTDRLAKSRGVDTPEYAFDIVTEPAVHEMTLDEIGEKLGYKVKIVNKENDK